MTEQIRLRTLIREDPYFRKWFSTPPVKEKIFHTAPVWRLFVQQEQGGRWAKVDLPTYAKAHAQVKLRLPHVWDMAIHSQIQHFEPPLLTIKKRVGWWPCPDGHGWCELCRRPVLFKHLIKHPNLKYPCDPEERRCSVCGMRENQMKKYKTVLEYPVSSAKS